MGSHRRGFDSCRRTLIVVDEFFSTVPGKNFDLRIISTRTKTQYLYKDMMVWNTKDIVLCFFSELMFVLCTDTVTEVVVFSYKEAA